MCVVSMIGDAYRDRWYPTYPVTVPGSDTSQTFVFQAPITRQEFDALKAEVEQMKELLKRAKVYDEEHGEPDCEMDEKIALLRKVADLVGVSLDDVL